jgi:dTMP kinase
VRGLLLTLEGIEGSGKTTQARRIKAWLDAQGVPAVATREPGGSPLAERIRDLVLTPGAEPLAPGAEILLFLAARAQHVERTVRPALARREVVVCDRFTDATLAYQGGGRAMPDDFLRSLNGWATGSLCPDRTYLLDVPVAVGLGRARERRGGSQGDRFESEGEAFFEAIRERYLALAHAEPERIVLLRGIDPEESIWHQIQQDLARLIHAKGLRPPR